jgi:hypothetical protein
MSSSQIREWTHEHCPEYKSVMMGRRRINYRDLFLALKFDNPDEMEKSILEHKRLEAALDFK